MKKKLLIGISLLICGLIQAQEAEQYFYLTSGGGLHNLSYSIPGKLNDVKGGAGFQLNAGYNYFFNPSWGIQAGLSLQSFNASANLNMLDSIDSQLDTDGDKYKFYAQYNNWTEKQHALFFEVPISVVYRLKIQEKTNFLLSLGGKISFPISSSYKITSGNIATSGYYEDYNLTLTDLPQNGFPIIEDVASNYYQLNKIKGYNFLPSYSLNYELGIVRNISKFFDLYVGGYLNYGINNILKLNNTNICTPAGYVSDIDKFKFNYNGVLAARQIEKVNPVSVGIKVGVYFNLSKYKDAKTVKEYLERIVKDTVIIEKEISKPVYIDRIINNTDSVRNQQQFKDFMSAIKICNSTTIRFKLATDEMVQYDQKIIAELAQYLKSNPKMILHIIGHTDNISNREFNYQLGLSRAVVVKRKIMELGVNSSQLIVESKGFDNPIAPNNSEKNREKNRRVQFEIDVLSK